MSKIIKLSAVLSLTLVLLVGMAVDAYSTTMVKRNLEEMTKMAEYIFTGKLVDMRDGLQDGNVPYTEYTFQIREKIKGDFPDGDEFSYRQFGLLEPRDMGNGKTMAILAPSAFPTYKQDEMAMIFLYKKASMTGLQTSVGLFQGKFTIKGNAITNGVNNENLFDGMSVDSSQLTKEETDMLSKKAGPADADTFVSFVKKAVATRLFE